MGDFFHVSKSPHSGSTHLTHSRKKFKSVDALAEHIRQGTNGASLTELKHLRRVIPGYLSRINGKLKNYGKILSSAESASLGETRELLKNALLEINGAIREQDSGKKRKTYGHTLSRGVIPKTDTDFIMRLTPGMAIPKGGWGLPIKLIDLYEIMNNLKNHSVIPEGLRVKILIVLDARRNFLIGLKDDATRLEELLYGCNASSLRTEIIHEIQRINSWKTSLHEPEPAQGPINQG